MKCRGFVLKRVAPDGNCLFRAVSEAVYGDDGMHDALRELCVQYMRKERSHFSRYVTEDFEAYLARKAQPSVHGNNVEMHALCELFCRPILVYNYAPTPINSFQPVGGEGGGDGGGEKSGDSGGRADGDGAAPIHLSYHNRSHFNALIDTRRPAVGVGLSLPGYDSAQLVRRGESDALAAAAASERETIDAQFFAAAAGDSEDVEIDEQIERAVLQVPCADARVWAARGASQWAAWLRRALGRTAHAGHQSPVTITGLSPVTITGLSPVTITGPSPAPRAALLVARLAAFAGVAPSARAARGCGGRCGWAARSGRRRSRRPAAARGAAHQRGLCRGGGDRRARAVWRRPRVARVLLERGLREDGFTS